MKRLRASLGDRKARQRGSVLGGLLIMVAFLSILIGALMTELSSAFLVSRDLNGRMQREATDSSAVELGLYQLANSTVPPVCVRDSRGPWYVASLNGSPAAVTQTCTAIVPDTQTALPGSSFAINGTHEITPIHNVYIVGDQSGTLRSYPFGTTSPEWTVATGGVVTAPAFGLPDPSDPPDVGLAVPDARTAGTCGGHCVLLYNQRSTGAPPFACTMAAVAVVSSQPAGEVSPTGTTNFPSYIFFGDSGGNLSVNDGSSDGGCSQQAGASGLGGVIVGQPLVFTGTTTSHGGDTTKTADIFVVVSSPSSTSLQEWQYSETTSSKTGTTKGLALLGTALSLPVGGLASESGPSTAVPSLGGSVRFAVVGGSGQIAVVRINVSSSSGGATYSATVGAPVSVGGAVVAAPYWCHCPGGDAIGVGSTNGSFYMFDTNLNLTHRFTISAAIRSTPTADANGDWYFGADDGNVYDVEVPATGVPLFNAAIFPLGGTVLSSPVEAGCGTQLCVYFGSDAGSKLVKIGKIRVMELRACVTTAPSSVNCAAGPRLWARAMIVGGTTISVTGWSYYSP